MRKDHLLIIQDVIERLSNNSFLIKGWTILLMVASFAFIGKKVTTLQYILVPNMLLLILWILDSYYLQLERKYRILYDNVRLNKEKNSDFNMNLNAIKITIADSKKLCLTKCMFSITELLFYIPCIFTIMLIYLLR